MSSSFGDTSGLDHGISKYRGQSMELSDRGKTHEITTVQAMNDGDDSIDEVDGTRSTAKDTLDMRRMGKPQQLVRRFQGVTFACFIGVAVCNWEYALFTISPGLVNGGIPGLLYSMFWCMFGFLAIYLSLSEMASMAPIAGSLYHWVSEFAPENIQAPLSYIAGWTSTIGWQAANAEGVLLLGTQIQVMISIMNPDYAYPAWQGTLFSFAAIICAYVLNVYGVRALPYWQAPVFAIAALVYFALVLPIWINAPSLGSKAVWTEFSDTGNWGNMGFAILVGQLSGISLQTGVDTAAHMSEEVKDASLTVPRAMLAIFAFNTIQTVPLIVTLCYHLTDLQAALQDPTTYPTVWVLRQCMSDVWILVLMVIITALNQASNITFLAAVSRDLFAFSRDKGVPFSDWLSKVDPKTSIPKNANIFSCLLSAALCLIYIGSPVAFYAIVSLSVVAVLQCYVLAIGCLLWRRIKHPETLPPSRFSLGRWGVPMNVIAVSFSAWSFFWLFWPESQPVTASSMNWAGPIFTLALLTSIIYYFLKARHHYIGPVSYVEGRHVGSH